MVRSTLVLYRSSLRAAGASLRRSPLAALFLVGAALALTLLGVGLAPLGLVGGILVGFAQAYAIGWYLSFVRIAVTHRRPVRTTDLRAQAGALFNDVITVMFVWWILGLIPLGGVGGGIALAAVQLAFNPIPEAIWGGRERGFAIFGASWRFLVENAPEWLIPQAMVTAGVVALETALGARPSPGEIVGAAGVFGSSFRFFVFPFEWVGWFPLPVAAGAALVLAVVVHAVMLFRGHLYLELSSGNRRQRAWRDRMGR